MSDDDGRFISEELQDNIDPTEEDIALYCEDLGIDRLKYPDLVWIAYEGFKAPLPPGWKFYRDRDNPDVTFFFDTRNGESISEHPLDHKYRELYLEEKRKKDAGLPYARCKEDLDHPVVADNDAPSPKKRKKKHHRREDPPTAVFELDPTPEPMPAPMPMPMPAASQIIVHDNDELKRKQDEHRREIADAEQRFNEEMRQTRARHDQRVDELRAQQNSEIDRMQTEFQQRRNQKQSELASLESQKTQLTGEHQRQLQEMKDRNQEEVEQLKRSLDEQLRQIGRENEQKVREAREKGEREAATVSKQQETKVAELKAANKREMDEIKREHRAKVESMKKAHEAKLKEIRTKADQQLERERTKVATLPEVPKPNPVNVVARFDSVAETELARKRKEYEDELARLMTQNVTMIAERKSELENQLIELQKMNNRAMETAKNECEAEIRKYKDKVKKEKDNIIRTLRQEAQKTEIMDRKLVIQRLVSIRPVIKPKVKLHRSSARSISVDDDVEMNCSLTRPQMVFQKRPKRSHEKSRKNTEELDLTFTDRKKMDLPPIEPIIAAPEPELPVEETLIERTESEHQKMKRNMEKTQREFENSSERILSRMTGVFGGMSDECRELRSFIQEQNLYVSKAAMEFRQQSMELSRNCHVTLSELENVHHSAMSTITSMNRSIDLPLSPQPPQIVFAPQPPYPAYSLAPGRPRSSRRSRYSVRRGKESDSD